MKKEKVRVHIIGANKKKITSLMKILSSKGFIHVEENPDVVVSYGGDGMFLIAERIFPGVPVVAVKHSLVGNMTYNVSASKLAELYLSGDYSIEELPKLKAIRKGRFEIREQKGINDIVIRNSLPTEAIRFRYRIGVKKWSDVLIGDGLVISTAYGSNKGAYFYSIVQKSFKKGIGIAFNNTTLPHKPLFLSSNEVIEIEVSRGIGVLVGDNNRDFVSLEAGDTVKVSLTGGVARRIIFNTLT